jgi:predicted lipid-binding transport protein (Tim44 family)
MPIMAPKKKRSLLPVLTVLFVLSYGLMTMLIVEQGAAIQSQRNTIKVLLRDSTELWAAKGKAISDQQIARSQTPSSQTPSTQAPSTQAVPRQHSQSSANKIAKPGSEHPPIPAVDLVDQRRSLRTI